MKFMNVYKSLKVVINEYMKNNKYKDGGDE